MIGVAARILCVVCHLHLAVLARQQRLIILLHGLVLNMLYLSLDRIVIHVAKPH